MRQAGASTGDELGAIADQCFELVKRTGNDASNLRKRWDNRIVLERSSVSELYVDGRFNIAIHGKWESAFENYKWLCRVISTGIFGDIDTASLDINTANFAYRDGRDKQIMLVVVIEGVEGTYIPS